MSAAQQFSPSMMGYWGGAGASLPNGLSSATTTTTTPLGAAAAAGGGGGGGLYGAAAALGGLGRPGGFPTGAAGLFPPALGANWNALGYPPSTTTAPTAQSPTRTAAAAPPNPAAAVECDADIHIFPPTTPTAPSEGNLEYQKVLKANAILFAGLTETQQQLMARNIYEFITSVRGRRFVHRNFLAGSGGTTILGPAAGSLLVAHELGSDLCRLAAQRSAVRSTWLTEGLVTATDIRTKKMLVVRRAPTVTPNTNDSPWQELTYQQLKEILGQEGPVHLVLLPHGVKPVKAKGIFVPSDKPVGKKKRGPYKKKNKTLVDGVAATPKKRGPKPKAAAPADAASKVAAVVTSPVKQEEEEKDNVQEDDETEKPSASSPKRGTKRKTAVKEEEKEKEEPATKPPAAKRGRKKKQAAEAAKDADDDKPTPKEEEETDAKPAKKGRKKKEVATPKAAETKKTEASSKTKKAAPSKTAGRTTTTATKKKSASPQKAKPTVAKKKSPAKKKSAKPSPPKPRRSKRAA